MTALELRHRILRGLDIEQPTTAPTYVIDDVTQSINQAFQTLWLEVPRHQRTHYTRQSREIALVPGQRAYAVPDAVQDVLPPVSLRSGEILLRQAEYKSEIMNHAQISGSANSGRPEAFFIDRSRQAGSDATKITLLVAPTPITAETIDYDSEIEAPRFTNEDFCLATPPSLGMPHNYVESLLLPIAMFYAASSHWFNNPDRLEGLEKEFMRALARVGATNPQLTNTRQTTGDKDV